MNSEINDQETEETPWRWSDKIEEIREAIIARTPEHLDRYDGLVWLRARLMDYEEAIEATILGYDPDDPGPEAVFGDTTLMETMVVMATLSTVPADVRRLLKTAHRSDDATDNSESKETEAEMEKSLKLHHHLNENPNADLPDVQVQYWDDCDILDVHTGDTTGMSATIAHGMYIYRNKDYEVSGFCIMDAVGAFRAGISKTVIISQHKTPHDDLPEIHVDYLESSDLLQIHTGDLSGTCTTIANGMDVYQYECGHVAGFCLMDASRLLKPVLDSLGNESKLTLADIVASAGNSERR